MIGETGRNFAAGMSGGLAFIYDPADTFVNKCNLGMVSVSRLSPEHATPTGILIHMNILYACQLIALWTYEWYEWYEWCMRTYSYHAVEDTQNLCDTYPTSCLQQSIH